MDYLEDTHQDLINKRRQEQLDLLAAAKAGKPLPPPREPLKVGALCVCVGVLGLLLVFVLRFRLVRGCVCVCVGVSSLVSDLSVGGRRCVCVCACACIIIT